MYRLPGEMPVGFAMSLSMNDKAMKYYSGLSLDTQTQIVNYIQNNKTGMEAREKVENAIRGLENNNTNFL